MAQEERKRIAKVHDAIVCAHADFMDLENELDEQKAREINDLLDKALTKMEEILEEEWEEARRHTWQKK